MPGGFYRDVVVIVVVRDGQDEDSGDEGLDQSKKGNWIPQQHHRQGVSVQR
jgi:hypothetical protein